MSVRFYLMLIGGLALIDRIAKIWTISLLDSGGFFVGDFFSIRLFENHGAIFGLPKISPFFEIVVIIVGLALSAATVSAWRKKEKFLFLGLILILLGGFSNFFDRLLYGFVVDMIHIGPSVWNLADMMIGAGFGIAIIGLFRKS